MSDEALLVKLEGIARSWRAQPSAALLKEARKAARAALRACGESADRKAVQSVLNGFGVREAPTARLHA